MPARPGGEQADEEALRETASEHGTGLGTLANHGLDHRLPVASFVQRDLNLDGESSVARGWKK